MATSVVARRATVSAALATLQLKNVPQTRDALKKQFVQLAKNAHPDSASGSAAVRDMGKLTEAHDELKTLYDPVSKQLTPDAQLILGTSGRDSAFDTHATAVTDAEARHMSAEDMRDVPLPWLKKQRARPDDGASFAEACRAASSTSATAVKQRLAKTQAALRYVVTGT